jgi:uncharacterized membrane protein
LNLRNYKALFIVIFATLTLIVASPALQKVLISPRTDFFTALSLLGPTHIAEGYPYNIAQNTTYTTYIGLANNMGSCGYYLVEVKLRNETQPKADPLTRTSSSQPPLWNITAFVPDKQNWEYPLSFSFDYTNQTDNNTTSITFKTLKLNDASIDLSGYTSTWNSTAHTYFSSLSFELWAYNTTTQNFQYNERFLNLQFNMTIT